MFARIRLEMATNAAALTVPQRAMARGAGGTSTVMLVTPANIVEPRSIQAGGAIGDRWIVTSGLQPGDRIIVQGLQKVRPGAEVKLVPFVEGSDERGASAAPKKE